MDDWSNGGESARGWVGISSMKKALWGPGSAARFQNTVGSDFQEDCVWARCVVGSN